MHRPPEGQGRNCGPGIRGGSGGGGGGGGGGLCPPVNKLGPPLAPLNLESYYSKQFWVKCAVCPVNYMYIKRKTSPAAKFKSAFAGWHRARDTHVFKALRIITNHIQFCLAYECMDQSEAFRWVIAETRCFLAACAGWLNSLILSSETMNVRY